MFGDSSSGVVTDTAISKTLVFVTTDHFGKTKQCDRKAIKKRAANGRGRPKRILASSKPRAGTWLKHDADTKVHVMITEIIYPSPSMFPGISAPTMTKVYTAFAQLSQAFYPQSFCSIFQIADDAWFVYLHQDPVHCYVYPYIAESYFHPGGYKASKLLSRLLPCIQANLEDSRTVSTDPTISAVLCLASSADVAGDIKGLGKHVHGLHSIVKLRGGISGLKHPWLQSKCCRVDIQLALYTGSKPLFFSDDISWEPFFTAAPDSSPSQVELLSGVRDTRLRDVLADAKEFCTIANLAHVTGRRMKPQLFQEIMVSLQYRLLHLEFGDTKLSAMDEMMRLTALSFTTTIFLQVAGIGSRYHRLAAQIRETLATIEPPTTLNEWHARLWMITAASMSMPLEPCKWLREVMREALHAAQISTWLMLKSVLKEYLWIDVIHDVAGRRFSTHEHLLR